MGNRDIYLKGLMIAGDCLDDPTAIIDIDGNIHYMSKPLRKWVGLDKESNYGNIFTEGLPSFLSIYHKYSEQIKLQHISISQTHDKKVFLETFRTDESTLALFVTKTPIFDDNNNFIFLHLRFKHFTIARVANLAYKFYGLKSFPTKAVDFEKYELTKMQRMVLYMYARNYSYTEVADLLTRFGFKISPSSVNKRLDQLKKIFGASSNEILKDMSLKLGYDVAIPSEFIPEGSHDITGDMFELWVC